MKIFYIVVLFLLTTAYPMHAKLIFNGAEYPLNEPLKEYFAAEDQNYNKSVIYIFFNNYQNCDNCQQAIELTEQVYNEYYNGKYSMFVINYEEDNEYDFASAYKLGEPLSIVLVKIQDGVVLGYQKISDPQNIISLGEDYITYLRQQIDSYFNG